MARLVWKRQNGDEKTFQIADAASLGRDATLDCVLDVKSVSRRHAQVERRESDFYITDLGSRNGTLVNGSRIQGETRILTGDRIHLGDELLEFDADALTGVSTGHMTQSSMLTAPLEHKPRARPGSTPETFPKRIGKFYLLKRLGHGGMGTVYRAIDLDSNREVAVKFIRATIGRNEAFLDFFHNREAVLAREIEHPNVIRIYEHGVDGDSHYISMEFIAGDNLYNTMKVRRLRPDEVLEIVRQLACGLVAAHRQNVVHSDIKPANILLVGEKAGIAADVPAAGAAPSPEEPADGILEFDTGPVAEMASNGGGAKYEPALLEEIRRRVGEPSRDVIVDAPFYERPSETSFLAHYFDRALTERGYFVLVEGDAGTGKNRILSEFLKARRAPPGEAGAPQEGSPVFLELDCARIEGLPLLYEDVFKLRPTGAAGLRQVGEELTKSFADESGPKVLRLLNLGTANPAACEWLGSLAPLMARKQILLLGTLAPDEIRANGSVKQLLDRMALHSKELYLRPLTEYQIQRYLQQIFRDGLAGLDLAADLHRLSDGNFARLFEILRGFFDRGVLTIDKPSGRLHYRPRAQELELEEGKHLYEKLKTHGKIEQHVLEHAAFIGPRFIFDTLLKLHDINETSLYFIVRTMLAEGFLAEEGRTWYGFTNVAFQRYMAERIPAPERPHLHRKISRLLQIVPVPESPELLQLRGRHFTGCNEFAKAVGSLLEGAHMARCEYRVDLAREMVQEILRIYRLLARRESARKEVTGILRDWFRKDGNWYEILGEMASDEPMARVKIADFGISFRMKDEERGYQLEKRPVLGTPRYIAPERGKGEYGGFKSDIFSLGVIAYEMAAGEPPFPELKGNDVIQANREMRIALPAEALKRYPPGMDALLAGMLEKDPQRRWDAERVVREVVKLQFDAKMEAARR